MSKVRWVVVAALVVALAAVGAGWKWSRSPKRSLGGGQSYLIAGWSWGGDRPVRSDRDGDDDQGGNQGDNEDRDGKGGRD